MTDYADVLDQIKSQLDTKVYDGEYLENFNIYHNQTLDDNVLLKPYCRIILDTFTPYPGFVGSNTATIYEFRFRFCIDSRNERDSVNWRGDKLMMYIVKEHIEFLYTMTLDTSNITAFERQPASLIHIGRPAMEEQPAMNDVMFAGEIGWSVIIMDEVIWT